MTVIMGISFLKEDAMWAGICKILELEVHGELTIFDLLLHGSKFCMDGCRIHSLLKANGFEKENIPEMVTDEAVGPVKWLAAYLSDNNNLVIKETKCFSLSQSFIQQARQLSENSNHLLLAEIDEVGVDCLIEWLKKQRIQFVWNEVDYLYQNHLDEKVESLEFDIADEREKMKLAVQYNVRDYEMRIDQLKESRRHRIARLFQQAVSDTEAKSKENESMSPESCIHSQAKINSLQMQVKLLDARFQSLMTQLKTLQKEAKLKGT